MRRGGSKGERMGGGEVGRRKKGEAEAGDINTSEEGTLCGKRSREEKDDGHKAE